MCLVEGSEVADEAPERCRIFLDKRRRGDDLVEARKMRLLVDVDHDQFVVALQMVFADILDPGNGLGRSRGHACYVQVKYVMAIRRGGLHRYETTVLRVHVRISPVCFL